MKKYPLRISVIYFLLASLWIFISDWSLEKLNPFTITYLQSVKGFLFVATTSVMIYFLISAGYRRITLEDLDYKRLFDESPHPILVYDIETLRIIAANHIFFAKYQYSLEEAVSLKLTDLGMPEENMEALDFLQKVSSRSSSDSGIWKSRNKSGDIFYVSIASFASTFKGRAVRMIVATDIDEEMKAKQALLSSEKKLKSLINHSSDAICVIDNRLNITTVNDAFETLYHQVNDKQESLRLPMPLQELAEGEEADSWIRNTKRALAGESVRVSERYMLSSGEIIYYDIMLNPMYDVNNHVIGVGAFSRNVTHLKSIELQLNKQLVQLREIAWIQSHELRRPLANIMGLIFLMQHDLDKPEHLKETMSYLQQSCNELDAIIRDIVEKSYPLKK